MITTPQIKKLHALKNALRLSEEDYRAALEAQGAESCKDLTPPRARALIDAWEALAEAQGLWQRRTQPRPKGGASHAQLRLVQALWAQVSRAQDASTRATALDRFCKRITGKANLTWCNHRDIEKLIKALKSMRQHAEKPECL